MRNPIIKAYIYLIIVISVCYTVGCLEKELYYRRLLKKNNIELSELVK